MSDSDSMLAVSHLANGSSVGVDRQPPALISVNASIGAKIAVKEEPGSNSSCKECKICGESLPDGILFLKHILMHGEPSSDDVENENSGRPVIGVSASVRVDLINHRNNEEDDDVNDHHVNGNGAVETCYDELIERVEAEVSNREGTYVCKVCRKEFRKKYSIACHLKVHTGERPFKCPICSRTFSLASNRRKHMLTHANYKPHKCRICGHCFSQKGNLLRHLASVHNNNDEEFRNGSVDSPKNDEDFDLEPDIDVDGEANDDDVDLDDNGGDLVIKEEEDDGNFVEKQQNEDVKPSCSLLYQMLKPKEETPPTPATTPPVPSSQPTSLLLKMLTPSSFKAQNGVNNGKLVNGVTNRSSPSLPPPPTEAVQNGVAPMCPLCGIKVTDTTLDDHLKRHPDGRPYQCDTCVRGFSSKVALINHLAGSHAMACPTCGLSFPQKDNLARHMASANHFPRNSALPADPPAVVIDPIALLSRVAAQGDVAAASGPLNLSVKNERLVLTPPPSQNKTAKEVERDETVQCRWCDEILGRWCDFRGHLKRKHNIKNLPASGRDSKAMREMIRTHGNSQMDPIAPPRNPSRSATSSPHLAALIRAPIAKRPWPSPAATPSPKQSRSSSPAAGPSRPKIFKPDFDKMIEQMQSRIQPGNPLEAADCINGAPAISDSERSVSFEDMVSEIMNQQTRQSTASSVDSEQDGDSRASESLVVEPDPEALIKCEIESDTESGDEDVEENFVMDRPSHVPPLLKVPVMRPAATPTPPLVSPPAAVRKPPPPLIKIQMYQPADVKPNLVTPPVVNGIPPAQRATLGGEDTGPQPSIEQVYQKWATECDSPVEPTFPPSKRRSRTAGTSGTNGAPKQRNADSGGEETIQQQENPAPGPSSSHHNRICCQLCDKRVFSSQEELGCHVASTHPNHYFCVNCSQVVDGHLDALEEHMANCFKQKLARRLVELASKAVEK